MKEFTFHSYLELWEGFDVGQEFIATAHIRVENNLGRVLIRVEKIKRVLPEPPCENSLTSEAEI